MFSKNTSYVFQFLFLSGIIIGHIGKIIKRFLFSYGIIDHIQNEILLQIVLLPLLKFHTTKYCI